MHTRLIQTNPYPSQPSTIPPSHRLAPVPSPALPRLASPCRAAPRLASHRIASHTTTTTPSASIPRIAHRHHLRRVLLLLLITAATTSAAASLPLSVVAAASHPRWASSLGGCWLAVVASSTISSCIVLSSSPTMAKRRAKKPVKAIEPEKLPQLHKQHQPQFMDHEIEVERQIAAIRAVRDVEIERLVIELRLLRSCFDEEQLKKPVLQVFEETLPNLLVVNDEGNKKFDVRWKERGGGSRMSMNCGGGDGRDFHASLLQRLSMAFPEFSASIPNLGGFDYSSNAGRTSFLGADNLNFKDTVLEEPSESQTLAMQEALRTPGVNSQRLSIGMTPKTLRLPKPGEMLLSVHGSPLGVFKENNMEAINESDEG